MGRSSANAKFSELNGLPGRKGTPFRASEAHRLPKVPAIYRRVRAKSSRQAASTIEVFPA
jgi:hypothetical protein